MSPLETPRLTPAARAEAAQERLRPIRSLYPFQPRFFAQGEHLQHYIDEGPPRSAPLVFLHGNPTWSFLWRDAIQLLAQERRCVALDHLGCGLSDKPQGWSYRLADHADNALRLIEALDLTGVTLVLHDWGGAIGFALARRAPERIARLVVMNTAAFRFPRIPLRIAVCRTPLFGKLAVRGLNAFARAATKMTTVRPLPAEVKRGFLLPYDSWEARIATHAFVEDIPMRPSHPSWGELVATEEFLPQLTDRPMAILWGERDWCFSPAFRAEWQRRFPAARVHSFPQAGHYLLEDGGPPLFSKLQSFLDDTQAAATKKAYSTG